MTHIKLHGGPCGAQWLADFNGCQCAPSLLACAKELETACCRIIEASALKMMGRVFHQFEPFGATGLILLAESHLGIHTWPEFSSVAIDLYVCNVAEDNSAKAQRVFQELLSLFSPYDNTHQIIQRGQLVVPRGLESQTGLQHAAPSADEIN